MHAVPLSLVAILMLASLGACAQAPPGLAQQWQTFQSGPFRPIRPRTARYPLSDQSNRGDWVPYAPMTDEFNGTKLDGAKWFPTNPTWKGRQPAWFNPANVTVAGGCLNLTMRKQDAPEDLRREGYHTYSSAAVQSRGTVLYGYFEVRAKPMPSAGSSAFWFYKADPEEWTEIDVFEIGGRAKGFERKDHITVHVFHTPQIKEHFQIGDAWIAPWDLDADFHVYGLEWDERELKFYVDGVLVRRGPNTHWHQPLTMNFDSETMPDWFGLPQDADLPSTYRIDYVRAWKHRRDAQHASIAASAEGGDHDALRTSSAPRPKIR
ncbi:MAG: LamG domain-containing protein; glycoside hydrolase family 16 protein [Chthonomonadales bacterium]